MTLPMPPPKQNAHARIPAPADSRTTDSMLTSTEHANSPQSGGPESCLTNNRHFSNDAPTTSSTSGQARSLSESHNSSSPAQSHNGASQRSLETSGTSVAPLPDSNEDLFPDFTTSLLPASKDNDTPVSVEQHSSRDIMHESGNRVGSRDWQKCLPAFIRPVTSQRIYRYHDFLKTKGAFSMPPQKLRNAIISRYVEFVYPQLPVVDIHDILNAIATNGTQGKVSLLLFQSILLAGSAYVDIEYVFEAAYRSRLALREELAERVRLLYDFDCETDRLILVQSLILMTSWQEKGDEVKHLRHWISVAHNIALLLGLNRDPSALPMPAKRKRLWKRVWWSLYLRDRLLALGLRQSPLIARAECNLSDLDHGDFDIQAASPKVCSSFRDCGLLQDLDQQERLVEVCIAQMKLSHHLADILQSRYTTFAPKMGCTKLIALVLVPKAPSVDADDVQVCSRSLDQWYRGLADHLKYRSRLSLSFDPGQGVLMLHCSILNLFYYALVCALHRPYPSPVLRTLSATEICFQRKSLHAADAIMSILSELQVHDLIGFLPTQGITFMMQAAITVLGESNSPTAYLQARSRQNLEACLQILHCLRDVHTYSFWATNLLTTAASKLHKRFQDARVSRAASPGLVGGEDFGEAGVDAVDYTNFSPLGIGEKAQQPGTVAVDDFELPAISGEMSTNHNINTPLTSHVYPDWADPYVIYDHSSALDIFLDLDWPG